MLEGEPPASGGVGVSLPPRPFPGGKRERGEIPQLISCGAGGRLTKGGIPSLGKRKASMALISQKKQSDRVVLRELILAFCSGPLRRFVLAHPRHSKLLLCI